MALLDKRDKNLGVVQWSPPILAFLQLDLPDSSLLNFRLPKHEIRI